MGEMFDDGMQVRSEIRRLLVDHDRRPRKAYGQNFLGDPDTVARIVAAAGVGATTDVVEIGAGTGALTLALAAAARRVVAYEVDHGLESILDEVLSGLDNVDLRFADASRVDFNRSLEGSPWTMVANLPYNIGTGILLDTLQTVPKITRCVVMVQREVADRLVAPPGSKTYGIPSVIVALYGSARKAFAVPRDVFEPEPRVDSSVVVIDHVVPPDHADRAVEIASVAFGQRRKMLRRSLTSSLDESVIVSAGIDPTARPETLAPGDFVAMAAAEAEAEAER
ncbi:MAG: 16S rRNA (adenine(1518)-N(6)/adenine(1519)-N(6))-dimethyltransferase RsmA [Acidimicrobiia bacterium]